jgi:hypothetical protein
VARQYGEKALEKLEEQGQGAESSDEAGMRVTFFLSLVWDTLGWVYFQQGDVKRAESLVRAAWLLGEEQLVAEHLGEIYEKEGKIEQAAHAYEDALAVSSAVKPIPGLPTTDSMNAGRKQEEEIIARYQKLTGKKPSTEIHRLPNGEWTLTPAEQLRRSRYIKLNTGEKLSGTAHFTVTFKPGKVDSVRFVDGEDSLKELEDKLKAAHYPLEFPPDSGAILVLRVDMSCLPRTGCVGTLMNAVATPMGTPVARQ